MKFRVPKFLIAATTLAGRAASRSTTRTRTPKPPRTLELTGAVQFVAQQSDVEGADGADTSSTSGGLPRFNIVAYTGRPMRNAGFYWPVIIDLSGLKAARTVKVLRQHDPARIVGHAEKTEITAKRVRISGVVSGTGPDAQEVVSNSKNNFPWEASVGVDIGQLEFVERGSRVVVNGQTVEGPHYVVRAGLLKEVSFVAFGADSNTSTSIAAAGRKATEMTFEEWLRANGFDSNSLTDKQRKTLKAAWRAELAAHDAEGDEDVDLTAGDDLDDDELADDAGDDTLDASDDDDDDADDDVDADDDAPRSRNRRNRGGARRASTPGRLRASRDRNPVPSATDIIADIRAEQVRVERIRALCASHNNPTIQVGGRSVSLQAHAIEQGWSVAKTELHALRCSRPQTSGLMGGGGRGPGGRGGASALSAQVVECALCFSAGLSQKFIEDEYDEDVLEAATNPRNGLRGIGIQQFFHMFLAAHGVHAMPGQRVDGDLIKAAFEVERSLRAASLLGTSGGLGLQASGFSTISLSGILSNLANKAMLERFALMQSVVPEIAFETDTNDFKPFTRYRLDGKGEFAEVGPDGELKHIELLETEYVNQLKTRGGMIALTRQMIRNDDLGGFLQIPQVFAALALAAREQAVIELILSNPSNFFGSGNKNFISGATTNLSIESLALAVEKFLTMKNKGGQFIMIMPDRLLVPPALKAIADRIYKSTKVVGQGADADPIGDENPYAGQYRPVVSPYLSTASGLSGASDKAWYLLAPPSAGAAIVQVGYLAGQRTPVIESAETDFNTLGMQWRSYWDFGAAMLEPRAGVKSKGES